MAVLASCATAFLVAFLFTPFLRDFARRRGVLDVPNERSSHRVPTPRNGGIAIVCGIAVAAILFLRRDADRTVAVILGGALATALAAAADEWRPLPYWLRLAMQIGIAVVPPAAAGLLLHSIALPFASFSAGWIALPLTLFWIVGVVNAYNFMDGLNGIASLEAVVCGATMALLALRHGDAAGAALAAAVAGAAAGFLPWNLRGSIFMGDIGSATLGFLFALMALRLVVEGESIVAAALPLAPFLLDTALTLMRRILKRERFYEAHRSHFYQRLNQLGWPHAAVSALWAALAAGCGAVALAYGGFGDSTRGAVLAAVVLVHAGLFAAIALRFSAPAAASR